MTSHLAIQWAKNFMETQQMILFEDTWTTEVVQ